jgi:aldehyde:ferredoxin oxidoreductase
MNGYTGKILRLNLTDREVTSIATSDYEEWVGGHGMGSAIFFDLVKDKTIDGFDPANVVTVMTSPLCGTLVPGASGRTEVQGIGVQSYPIGWFTRSNFGGRFSAMLKYAGWDGIVIEGKADTPVWIDARDDDVQIRDCSDLSLWGMDTRECQQTIWDYVAGSKEYGKDWVEPNGASGGRSTQRPAVVTMGPAGENLSRLACLIHDASNASGQGGFGAVWGAKNLKAISAIGTGSIMINDPKALMQARLWQKNNYAFDLDNLEPMAYGTEFRFPPVPGVHWGNPPMTGRPKEGQRPQACVGCHSGCRARYEGGLGNEVSCITSFFYSAASTLEIQYKASDLLNKYGLNAFEVYRGLLYIYTLDFLGVIGKGMEIDCPLNFDDYGSLEFVEQFVKMIAYRNDGLGNESAFGDDIAEGFFRAAKKWGRLEGADGDLKTGMLPFSCWGLPDHRDNRAHLEWSYGTILGDRDINEHDFDILYQDPKKASNSGLPPQATAEEAVTIYTDKMVPYEGDRLMLDYSDDNIYSEHIAKLIAWHRHYTRFWKQSVLYCDWRWPDFLNLNAPNKIGSTGEAEPKFLNAVTGGDFTFLDGMELGRKIWNLDHAIWTLQGRDRDMVHFAEYIYSVPLGRKYLLPGRKNGEWTYINAAGRTIDREKFEEFKTRFYELEGWDPTTGYPTRSTLESLDLGYVADELEEDGRLGEE